MRYDFCMHFRIAVAALISLLSVSLESQPVKTTKLNLHKVLGSGYACAIYQRPIQFLSDRELIILSGPTGDCYREVNRLQLVVISTDGQIISRRDWPSSDQGMVFDSKRLAVAAGEQLLILDDHLTTIQSVPLPKHRGFPVLAANDGGLWVVTDGGSFTCNGIPLNCVEQKAGSQPTVEGTAIYSFDDGRKLIRNRDSLIETAAGSPSKDIANLSWVSPQCVKYKYCQAYDAATRYQVVANKKRRILIMSNGSRYPMTDAAGLFPYFRLQVFDLDRRSEVYREEDISRTGQRSATISPDGDLLATFDGFDAIIGNPPWEKVKLSRHEFLQSFGGSLLAVAREWIASLLVQGHKEYHG